MLRPSAGETLRAWLLSALVVHGAVAGNPDAKRLYDDLLSNYNKLVRPVVNTSDVLRVCIKLKLSQLIDVLPSKSGFSQQCDMVDGDFASFLSGELHPGSSESELKDGLLLHFVPFDETYDENLEGHYLKPSELERKKKVKSRPSSKYSDTDVTKLKNSNSSIGLKSRRKCRKVKRSECSSKKFKYLDSAIECKNILENCNIISKEDCDKKADARNPALACFVMKMVEDAENAVSKNEKCQSNQSVRITVTKDEGEDTKVELKPVVSCVKMKDNYNQTCDVKDKCVGVNSSEIVTCTSPGEDTKETKNCTGCLKMNDYFAFQREFNASLLVQMENMLGQLTMMIKLLHELLKYKNCNGRDLNTERTLHNIWKMKESGEAFATELENKSSLVFMCDWLEEESKSGRTGYHEDNSEVKVILSEDRQKFDKDNCNTASGGKPRNIFNSLRVNTEQNKQLQKKTESRIPVGKSKCLCQEKISLEKKKNREEAAKKTEINERSKESLEQKENANKCPAKGGDQKSPGKNVDEEGDAEEEIRSDYPKMEIEFEDDTELTMGMRLHKNQIRMIIDEGNSESSRNDILLCCSEDTAVKPSPSRKNLKNQIMTTNLWVEQSWYDYKLRWDPKEYGGVHMLHVPSDHIWRPDIVLYNNADGNYEVTLMTKARVSHTGLVEWQPPAVYKSSCAIDVEFFPYDIQTCVLKLGSWTYDGFKVDLRHMDEKAGSNVVEVGVDLSEFYMSVEWDILEVPAVRNEKFYTCCDEPYLDITFNITMRRKTLFYTVNIIIPCMGISFLTVLTFYLPSDSGEKVTLSISILISLHVFFLLVVEIIPPTSLVVPLLGKYLIFAMILVSISICVTVVVLNVHFRSPQTHRMAPWVKRVFIHILPRLLVMRRPQYHFEPHRFMSRRVIMQTVKGKEIQTSYYPYPYQTSAPAENPKVRDIDSIITRQRTLSKEDFSPESLADGEPVFGGSCQIHGPPPQSESEELSLSAVEGVVTNGEDLKSPTIKNPAFSHSMCPPEVHKSCFCVRFIAEHTKMLEDSTKVKEDWKYVAMVLDRLFLWIFTLAVLVGTAGIILQAPTLYDDRIPIDKQFAEIQTSTVIRCPPQ